MKNRTRGWIGGIGLVLAAVGAAVFDMSCSSTPPNLVVRTFERAQRVDVVCMRVFDDNNNPIPPQPVVQAQCGPVVAGSTPVFHLYAMVTQSLRGELAVVDLTAGAVVDVSSTTPGINFLPVGQLPTDVASTPDGAGVFVAASEVEKPAIYYLPSTSLLGDALKLSDAAYADAGTTRPPPLTLASWPVCQLPQAPGNIAVLPKNSGDAGATGFQLVVVLPGNASETAKVVTMDVAPFSDPSKIPPGGGSASSVPACTITSAIELRDELPATWTPGPAWDNGVPYAPNIDLFRTETVAPVDAGSDGGDAGDAGDAEAGPPVVAAVIRKLPAQLGCDSGADDGGVDASLPLTLKRTPGTHPHGSSLAVVGKTLYIGDSALPVIHVIDASSATLREIEPLVVTSARDPARVVTTKSVAVSPATRDYKRFLYAIDRDEGSLIVYEITDPVASPHSPLRKPNAELNPFQPPDRIIFSQPVAAVAFVRHDVPLTQSGNSAALTGVLCNPNPAIDPNNPGAKYRPGGGAPIDLGPARLRGVFALATLSTGQIATIDVDDWDAPCRRPTFLDGVSHTLPQIGPMGDLAIAQASGLGAYEAPTTSSKSGDFGSQEWFFPTVAPHRPRSRDFLRSDANGVHIPNVIGTPQLFESNALAPQNAKDAKLLSPFDDVAGAKDQTTLRGNVGISLDDPLPHLDQDWNVTFEGALLGLSGIAGTLQSDDNYATVKLSTAQGGLCNRGIEDARLAQVRIDAMSAENPSGLPVEAARRLGDYAQFTDEVLPPADPYWTTVDNSCWDGDQVTNKSTRQTVCSNYFGSAIGPTPNPNRDFPILEAYDDHIVLGQYDYKKSDARSPSGHIRANATNPKVMRLAQCCFHNQTHFAVRAGGEWIASGSVVGILSHEVADKSTRACVFSCKPREVLLSSRMVEVTVPPRGVGSPSSPREVRNSAYLMRNPFFSAWMFAPVAPNAVTDPVYTFSVRDATWKFSIRGGFAVQTINLTSSSTAVVPQSMRFIESLGQLAVVDGSSQGLILIDLNTVSLAHAPYF